MPWVNAEKLVTDRLIVGAWGPPKTGKTHFALTFPGPIYYHNFDWGIAHHVNKTRETELFIANYLTERPDMDAASAEALLRAFERDYAAALQKPAGTIVIDTSSQLWQLASKVFLEKIKAKRRDGQIYPFDYADANAYFQNLVNQVKPTKLNMVLIQRAKSKYNQQGQDTGMVEQQGNNQIPYLVQMQVQLGKDGTNHWGEIEASWDAPELEGVRVNNPSYTMLRNLLDASAGKPESHGADTQKGRDS